MEKERNGQEIGAWQDASTGLPKPSWLVYWAWEDQEGPKWLYGAEVSVILGSTQQTL
jgi:hypothetical protein